MVSGEWGSARILPTPHSSLPTPVDSNHSFMYVLENPVLQRDLLVNLRMLRAFLLLVFLRGGAGPRGLRAWPSRQRLDMSKTPEEAKRLVNLFFLGHTCSYRLIAPSFAAGAITGEKERKTYEMLLASPCGRGQSCWESCWPRSATWPCWCSARCRSSCSACRWAAFRSTKCWPPTWRWPPRWSCSA